MVIKEKIIILYYYLCFLIIWYFKLANLESWGKKNERKAILLLLIVHT